MVKVSPSRRRFTTEYKLRILKDAEVTLVFDKGNDSHANLERVAREHLYFVSSLVPTQHKDVLALPKVAFHKVDAARRPGLLAHRVVRRVYGAERTVIVTFNPHLFEGQMQGLRRQRDRIEVGLKALQARLQRWAGSPPPRGKKPTPEGTSRLVTRLLCGREPGPFLRYEATADAAGIVALTYRWDDDGMQAAIPRSRSTHLPVQRSPRIEGEDLPPGPPQGPRHPQHLQAPSPVPPGYGEEPGQPLALAVRPGAERCPLLRIHLQADGAIAQRSELRSERDHEPRNLLFAVEVADQQDVRVSGKVDQSPSCGRQRQPFDGGYHAGEPPLPSR